MLNEEQLIAQFIHSPQSIMALGILLDKRIEELKDQLVTADLDRVKGLQYSISELRRFKNIKDIIIDKRKVDGQSR